ncbi:MAG TPA: dihydrodipicolinate reductase C-terminal domain-containing protein [Bryobacteraceae bacterium]|nr:dihydrodipicolinate reductase C-terminal domain-containing protein [Bryobacteraceae bacterium]
MNKLVEQLAPEYGFEIAPVEKADVAMEFTHPDSAPANLRRLALARIPTVCGTTGWYSELPAIAALFQENDTPLVTSPNFSVGVAVFKRLAGFAAELLKDQTEYGAWAWEIHHDAKKDSPSGTLIQLVETMRQHGYSRFIDTAASRAGKHPGTHEIGFDSAADTITLRHSARSREGFARGALKSAQWILGRQGIYTFDDVLFPPNC